jgi:carbon monoxide dehydrogenase subunit G
MRSVRTNVEVPYSPEQVYDFLDVMANHEPFTSHMMYDWELSGPERGVGSKARVKVSMAGRTEAVEVEVIASERPTKIVEQNTGAGGRRVANGTYTLRGLPNHGTRISFEYAWRRAPISERLAAPLVRTIMRRHLQRAMQLLAEQLQLASLESVGAD